MMFALLLVGALLAQSAFAKPTDCGVYCDDQNAIGTSGYATKGGYSSYSKSASYKQYSSNGGYGASNGGYGTTNSGLGATGGRLENFDEGSAIGTIGGDRPGTWADQKHYVTDDGHGEMKYRAGQTVTNNGFSKYAEHSYRYGTHDKHVPTANSQILSTAEFNRELQSIRNRISSFMSTFDFQSGSFVSANMLQDFKNKANVISGQLNNVCDQVDIGSSMHQQMQQMIQQFQHDVEQRQREIEAMIIQSSSSSSVTSEYHTYPTRPSPIQTYPTRPASIQTYPSRPAPVQTYPMPTYQVPTVSESTIMEQRVEEQISQINTLIQNFYSKFNKPEVNSEYQTNLNNQINTIRQKLNELNLQASQYESTRVSFEQLKTQFDSHVTRLQEHIQQLERRQFEVEQQQREAEQRQREAEQRRLEAEQKQRDAELRQLEAEQRQREAELKLQQEKQRQKLILEQEQEKQRQKLILEQEQQKLILLQQQQQLQQQQLQQQQLQQQQQQPVYKPQTNDQVKIEGSYHHSFQSSYGSEGTGATSGSLTHGGHQTYRPEAQVMQPHVDLTAAISRLQQDLHRLQTEVNGFNSYTMRLTASNSANLQVEAQKQADILRQNIKNLCDTSSRYHDQSILSNAENLKRRFEEMFQAFQSQAASYSSGSSFAASAGYSSESSYGGSGRVSSVQAPSIGDVEYTHSKSTDVEIGRRPYSSGSGYSASSGHSSGSSYGSSINDQLSSGLIDLGGGSNSQHVECVEMYAGQPCVEQPRRYKRHVGEGYDDDPFSYQRHRFVIDDFSGYNDRNEEFEPYSPYDFLKDIPDRNEEIEPYSSYDLPNYDRLTTDFNPINHGYSQQIQKSDQLQNQNMQLSRRVQDLTRHRGEIDDYYAEHNQRDHVNGPTTSEPPKLERNIDDSFQQHVNHGENEEYGSFQKPRSQIFKPKPTLPSKNLDSHEDSNNYGQPQNRFNHPNQRENPRVNFKPENVHSQTHYPSTTEKVFIPQHIPLQRKPETVQKPDSFTLQKSGFYDDVDDSQKSESNEESQHSVPLNYENVSRKPTQQLRSEEQTEKPQNVKPIQISEKEESVQKPEDLTLEKSGFDYFPGRSERPIVVIESQSTTPSYYDNKFVTSERTTKKPQNVLPIGTFENSQSIQEPEKFTLEKSGFNDYPSQPEQPKVNDKQEHVKPLITDNLQVSQKAQNLTEQHGLEHPNSRNEKVEKPKQFESDLTQQTAGQIDFGPASQVGRQFSSQSITKPERSSQNEKVEKSEGSDGDFTQQTSGPIDFAPGSSVARQFSSQNIAKIDKFSRDEKIEQLNRDLTQQTSGAINFGPESQTGREFSSHSISKVDKFSRNERVEKPERYSGDLTQQTAGQIDFGSESQIGRQYFSHGIAKPEAYGVPYKESQHETSTKSPENKQQNEKNNENLSQQHQQTPSNIQIFDSHLPNQQSESISEKTEKNNENSSQQHQQIPPNIHIFDSHLPNRQSQSINEQTERIGTSGKRQEPISIIHAVPMPAPVPNLIYTRPWQISELHNIRTQQNNKNIETQNADIDSQDSDYQNDSASHPAPLRGDLPGYTPPSTPAPQPLPSITLPPPTIPPPLPIITPTSTPFPIEEKPTEDSRYNQNGYINYNEKQQYEQVDLNKFNQVHDLPRSRNEWHFNNSEHNYNRFSYTGRGYNFNQQNEYSQRSHYYNQHNSGIDLGQQIQKPFDQQNSYVQLNHQSNPIRYNQRQQSMYQYHEQQTGKLKFEHQQLSNYNLEPTQIPQQSSQILLKRQTDFNQQSELPTFEQQSYQQHVNHQQLEPLSLQQENSQQRLENEFAEEVIPLDNTRSEDQWLEIESTTTPRTFWKRIGHKLSDTYDKAKERAKTIFG